MQLSITQSAIASHKEGPALVLAIPGAGKTTLILERVQRLVSSGIHPRDVLTLTFSKASALDMRTRAENRGIEGALFSTIHAFCLSLLRSHADSCHRTFGLIENTLFPKEIILQRLYAQLSNRNLTPAGQEAFFTAHTLIINQNIDPRSYAYGHRDLPEGFLDLYQAYKKYKEDHFLLDFDDLLKKTLDLLDVDRLFLDRVQKRFPYIQLDEGQDASKIQFQILEKLVKPKSNLFVVCDDDQSIYAFRGANPSYLLDFQEHYPGASIFHLEDNYRSGLQITQAASTFIAQNKIRYPKVHRSYSQEENHIIKSRPKDALEQADWVINEILKNPDQKRAVLFRYKASALSLAHALTKENLPFTYLQKERDFFSHPALKDLEIFEKICFSPHDHAAFFSLAPKLGLGFSQKNCLILKKTISGANAFDTAAFHLQNRTPERERLFRLKKQFGRQQKKSFPKRVSFYLNESGYKHYLIENVKRLGQVDPNPTISLDAILTIAEDSNDLPDFYAQINRLKERMENPSPSSPTSLSTIHGSKGLEFDTVIICDLCQSEFPSKHAETLDDLGQTALYEEERRLFYVALTRARKKIILSAPRKRNGKILPPSPFYKSISL